MIAALLALASSLAYGSTDFLAGLKSRTYSMWSVTLISQTIGLVLVGLLLPFSGEPFSQPGLLVLTAISGVGSTVGIVLYYSALAAGTMSVVAPIVASSSVIPVLVGLAIGERASALQYVGMALAIGGVALSSRVEGRSGSEVGKRSILRAIVAALGFGVVMVGLGFGGRAGVLWSVFAMRLGCASALFAYILLTRRSIALSWRAVPSLVLIGFLGILANLLFTEATTMDGLGIVSVLGTLAPVVVISYAFLFLRERLTKSQIVAAGIVLCGVIAIGAG